MGQQKGGRGKKAPYVSKLMRVPEPIARQVEDLCQQYQDFLASGGDPISAPCFLEKKPTTLNIELLDRVYFRIGNLVRVRRADSLPQTQRTKRFTSRYEGKCGTVISCWSGRRGRNKYKGQDTYSVSLDDVKGSVDFFGNEIESVEPLTSE
jgi:hypothetical protein